LRDEAAVRRSRKTPEVFKPLGTSGGNRTFAALCIEVCYAGLFCHSLQLR
jgi:hypothetical protein